MQLAGRNELQAGNVFYFVESYQIWIYLPKGIRNVHLARVLVRTWENLHILLTSYCCFVLTPGIHNQKSGGCKVSEWVSRLLRPSWYLCIKWQMLWIHLESSIKCLLRTSFYKTNKKIEIKTNCSQRSYTTKISMAPEQLGFQQEWFNSAVVWGGLLHWVWCEVELRAFLKDKYSAD